MRELNKDKKPFAAAVFLSVILVAVAVDRPMFISPKERVSTEKGILGGPALVSASEGPAYLIPAIDVGPIAGANSYGGESLSDFNSQPARQDIFITSVVDSGGSSSPGLSRNNLFIYRVRGGDTLSGVASYFGVSLDTIVNANPAVKAGFIKPGDELNILPTSGIVYKTRDGDTLESVAGYFNIPEEKLAQFNKSINFSALGVGISLVIPGARTGFASNPFNSLPDFNNYFIKPSAGFNWGILHNHNAVDISNSCGTPVHAVAEGLVIPDENFGDGRGGWEGGYGNFVLIEHPFGDGIRTRYAHLEKIFVEIGDYVKQGQEIGLMGQTGDATGCHVHFEVYGAANPFAKY